MARKAAAPGFERLPLAARNAASRSAAKLAIESNRLRALAGTVGLHPGADLAARLVEAAGGVLVAAPVEVAEVVGEANEEAQLLDAEVGAGEVRLPAAGVGGLDEGLQHVEGGALDAVAEQEALGARKTVQGGDEPEDKAVVEFEGGAGVAGTVGGELRGLGRGRLRSVRFGLDQDSSRQE